MIVTALDKKKIEELEQALLILLQDNYTPLQLYAALHGISFRAGVVIGEQAAKQKVIES